MVRGRAMMGAGLVLGAIVGACQGSSLFVCTVDGECMDGSGAPGFCESSGLCSFPDDECDSGRRYGEYAGGLSRQCVDDGVGTGSDGTIGGASGSDGGSGPEPADSTDGEGPLIFVDDDEADFAAGQWDAVIWQDGGMQLDGGPSGIHRSRVFDAGATVTWATLAWEPRAPYGKPLPDGGEREADYVEGNADMDANVLLLHLDGEGAAEPGSLLPDASGWGHDFLLESPAPVSWIPGRFGEALADDMGSYAHNGVWVDAFSFGEDGFTWAMWVRSTVPCDGPDTSDNQVYLGIEGDGPDRSHLWLGCRHPTSSSCPRGDGTAGRVGGTYDAGGSGGPRLCGPRELVDDQWHHLVVTKLGHADAQVTVYLDGRIEDLEGHEYVAPVEFPFGTELAIGAFTNGTFPAAVTIDEVAIWRRALSAEEIEALVRRATLGLSLKVRLCDEPSCEGAGPFVGPDGTEATAFVDPAGALSPGSVLELPPGLQGRYFQYQAELESEADGSPVLESVRIEALAP